MNFAKLDLQENQQLARAIIEQASKKHFKDRHDFERFRNAVTKENKGKIFHNLYFVKAYNDLVKEARIKPNSDLLKLIQKRSVRTMSGVAPVTVLMKPFPCPGKCIYCPTDVRMPKSYLPSQPAAQRAFRQRFNPYTQVFVRLKALSITGHEISKVELRVLGGTWSSYTKPYQIWFLKKCLQAMNEFYLQTEHGKTDKMAKIIKEKVVDSAYGSDKVNTVILKPLNKKNQTWAQIVKENETAAVRCIGINVETRPDFIDQSEVKRLRYLGVTKVEIGVQTTDDRVQEITKRGHDLASVRQATALLKDAGFKISYHMMPNLPGSTVEIDKKMIGELFADDQYQPDYLKIYPCVVVPKSILSSIYRKGFFKPYDDATLEDVLLVEIQDVTEWCRIDRIARDIPSTDIEAGFKASNIRQILEERLKKMGKPCRDIRAREIQNTLVDPKNIELVIRKYLASGGQEFFISYEDVKQDKLVALLRLRFPKKTFIPELRGAALIREVHVYGKQIAIGHKEKGEKQHVGWGTRLMHEAEKMAREAGFVKMAVIAGIGTREYYKKKGYRLEGTYMVKDMC
ncbi:tRNA uridine(34) 5-carboxymethylaminomethyl modification radical SAM/GNAT enzyme Elp3 [Candidatus Peregrinibacteria bacterium]|nr:tRNA uridine(34) 5-carboxymethylaminomethyl modification radical SAM/GNAT enzyme Elp3 [Candidatus Peregrinibacteria bacterium]